jgi:hypothetical protein
MGLIDEKNEGRKSRATVPYWILFSSIGHQISDSVLPVEKDLLDYIPINPKLTALDLGKITTLEFAEIISSFESKQSLDIDGCTV